MSDGVVVDTSALVALLLDEPDKPRLLDALLEGRPRWLSSLSLLEAHVVISKLLGPAGVVDLDALLLRANIEVIAFGAEHALLARQAWDAFGKGRHPAQLNLGDCCAYALARHAGFRLLAKGDDFPKTDVQLAT